MKEKKIFIGFIIITVLLVVIVSVVLYLNEKQVKKTNININNNTNGQYIQFIEYLIVDKNGGFEIKGWMIPATEDITEANFSKFLDMPQSPDVDLLIRTGGEKRLSNYLLWHIPYAEQIYTDTLWPDYSDEEFYAEIEEFQHRNRRFGAEKAQKKEKK